MRPSILDLHDLEYQNTFWEKNTPVIKACRKSDRHHKTEKASQSSRILKLNNYLCAVISY